MTDIGEENIVQRILTPDAFSEVRQYKSDRENMMVYPKNVTPPNNKNEGNVILGLESIVKPFNTRLSPINYIRQIRSLESVQARLKARKSSFKEKLKFLQTSSNT